MGTESKPKRPKGGRTAALLAAVLLSGLDVTISWHELLITIVTRGR